MLTALWFVFITTLSLVSFNDSTITTFNNSDKLVHFTFYFVLTLLLFMSFKIELKHKYLIVIAIAVVYGIIIEILQEGFTLTRKADIYDVVANAFGVFCAALLNKYVLESISSKIIKKN